MAERRERTAKKRFTFDVSTAEHGSILGEARAEGISLREFAARSLRVRSTLRKAAQEGLTFRIQDSQGNLILEMESSTFLSFLEMDPNLREYFLKKNPYS